MVNIKSFQLQCVILTNHPSCQFTSKEAIFQSTPFDYVYNYNEGPTGANPLLDTFIHQWQQFLPKQEIYYYDELQQNLPILSSIAVGGTFDQLHNGHRKLLTLAVGSCSEMLTIGITSTKLLSKKSNNHLIKSFQERQDVVEQFIRLIKPDLRLNFVELNDPYGPTIEMEGIEGIVVSSETVMGAIQINQIRVEQKKFLPLKIFITRRFDAATLSSSFIRNQMEDLEK